MKCLIYYYFHKRFFNKKKLAEAIGISREAVYNILNSKSIPRVDTAIKIVEYINNETKMNWTVEELWKEDF